MTIAVLGGTGFIGTHLMARLAARGDEAVAIARGRQPVGAVPFVAADRMDTAALLDIFRSRGVDTVIDIFALGLKNTAPVFEAVAAVGARYLLVSSVDVYRNYGGLLKREEPPIQLEPAREDDPLRGFRYPYRGNDRRPKGVENDLFDDYDKIVLEEAALADRRFTTTVVRPPMIFGPGDKQRRFGWAIGAVREGGLIPLDERAGRWPNSYGYVVDIADAMALAATSPKAAGRIYNIGQPFVRTPIEWLLTFGVVMGRQVEVETVPPAQKGLLWDRAEASDLRYPLTLDTTRIREELGFEEPTGEIDALRATIADDARHAD